MDIDGLCDLAPLETFDPEAFKSEDPDEQDACTFVLALAIAFNDLSDRLWAYAMLKTCRDHVPVGPTSRSGDIGGKHFHVVKLLYSCFSEIAELIAKHPKVQDHSVFKEAVRLMKKDNREHWNALVDFSNSKASGPKSPLMQALLRVRNKVSNHYSDLKYINRGYRRFFEDASVPGRDDAFISRGKAMQDTRFFFADAAVQGCFETLTELGTKEEIADKLSDLTRVVNMAIYNLIERFVEARGFHWRRIKDIQ
ncbi:MAG: hypothetical protein ABIJ96_08385 [Elusimicrobiota bacterium]